MESVIERITRGQYWQFHGGIHPPEQKFLTCTKPIVNIALPEKLIIPVRQHIGSSGELLVKVGDNVLKGDALTKSVNPMSVPVHAPTSGTIIAIEEAVFPHPSGLRELSIILTPDHEDTWRKRSICENYLSLTKPQIIEKIANAGIAGMGGAGFPTQVKAGTSAKIDTLIINAAECEPYITADDLLIQEHSPTILQGIKILEHLLSPQIILIAIEDNKAKAIDVLKKITADFNNIYICVIPTKYPSGGEKQLIKILTGKEVPRGLLPSAIGIAMQNIATCFAIADAVINDTPLIKRVVTVSGQALEKPQNVWALLGTPVATLTAACGYSNHQNKHLIMGGPMMGFSLSTDQVPVIKTTNCILAPSEIEIASPFSSTSSKEVECIRCGQCADVCPAQLLPQELQWSAKAKDQQQLETLNLFDCIECGACAYVCPSQIPLVHYYRVAKSEIRQQKLLDLKAEKAKIRFEARKKRLEKEKLARAAKHQKAAEARKARMNANTAEAKTEKSAVAAALARVKAKKAQADNDTPSTPSNNKTEASPEKSQVANAIARAKAKKLAQQAKMNENPDSKESFTENEQVVATKDSKVAAAIAKAKAKKLAKSKEATEDSQANNEESSQVIKSAVTETDPKKAKIAAAIAKAKAKKLANSKEVIKAAEDSQVSNEEPSPVVKNATIKTDPKKAKIAAAIAKAKAKKLANSKEVIQAAEDSQVSNEESSPVVKNATIETDPKKAKIAAAIAKAKAKKLAAQRAQQTTSE